MKWRWIFSVLILLAMSGCDNEQYPYVPENVRNTLDQSGRNYIEFLEAIVDYRNPKDSLELKSLYYLIAYMPRHGYRTYLLQSSQGLLIDYNIREYKNYKRSLEIKDSIALKHDELYFMRHYFGKDIFIVESDFLKNLVDSSMAVWENSPWSSGYSFEVFKEKILPKRLNTGPFNDWMTIVRDSLLPNPKLETKDPFVVADLIHKELKGYLQWDRRYIENPTDQGWTEMKEHRRGRTEDAAVLLTAALRSYGIAADIDFIPLATESKDYSTYWVTVWDAEGNKKHYYPFEDKLLQPKTFPKVFRRTYHSYHHKLYSDSVIRLLKYHHLEQGAYRDVTDEYTETTSVEFGENVKPVHDFSEVFLCFKHEGKWIPFDWKYFSGRLLFNKLKIGQRYALTDRYGNILYEMKEPVQ